MGDEIFVHFNSNSLNQSDQSEKMAKLRARMEKKDLGSSTATVAPPVQQVVRFFGVVAEKVGGGRVGGSMELLSSSDSDGDDNVGGFLIQVNTQKRQKMQEGDGSKVEHIEFGRKKEPTKQPDAVESNGTTASNGSGQARKPELAIYEQFQNQASNATNSNGGLQNQPVDKPCTGLLRSDEFM